MEPDTKLEPGDVVQLNPETVGDKMFGGCFMVVTIPKSFGAQGYVPLLSGSYEFHTGRAYYRAGWAEMEFVGRAKWWEE